MAPRSLRSRAMLAAPLLAAGRVVFDEERTTHVFSPVSGRVVRVLVQTGDRVKRGAPLAVVESPDVGAASADLAKAMAELTSADHERQRQKDLAAAENELAGTDKKLSNPAFLDKAPAEVVDKIKARREAAQAEIERITARLEALPQA